MRKKKIQGMLGNAYNKRRRNTRERRGCIPGKMKAWNPWNAWIPSIPWIPCIPKIIETS